MKTSYEAHYNIGNYYLFLLNDFIEVIELGKKLKVQNPIFTDFAEILTQRAIGIEEYKDLPVNEWRNGWIGFFKDIQNSIKTEWLNWGFVQNQNGGFWGMWGHFYEINYNNVKKIHFLLKQINENDDASIYFFIEPQEIEGIARKELKYKWADKFIEAGKKIGGEVVKVRRFGEGKNMAVAQYEGKVIFMGEDGKFIKDKTIEVLEKCKKIIEIASE